MDLAKINRISKELASISDLDELKTLDDKTAALVDYAKRSNAGLSLQNAAAEARLRVVRRLGEVLLELPRKGRGRPKKNSEGPTDFSEQLVDAGLSEWTARRAQNVAKIERDEFEGYIAEHKAAELELTLAGLLAPALTGDEPVEPKAADPSSTDKTEQGAYDKDEWTTPESMIERATRVLGSIDLDPASTKRANKVVGAKRILTKKDDALRDDCHWTISGKAGAGAATVWLNPPYSHPLIERFCDKLIAEFKRKHVKAALLLVNSATDTAWFQRMLRGAWFALIAGRVDFDHPDRSGTQNRQGQAVFCLTQQSAPGGRISRRFMEVFEQDDYAAVCKWLGR
jgi:phage N-6-adenine-methyltransferase